MRVFLMFLAALLFLTPAANAASSGSSSDDVTLTQQDIDELSELPLDDYVTPDLKWKDDDKDDDDDSGIKNPFAKEEEPKKKVKQVYKPTADMTLRRTIRDDRIDDGYVQSLIQQRAIDKQR